MNTNHAIIFETKCRDAVVEAMKNGVPQTMITGMLAWIADDVRDTVLRADRAAKQANSIVKAQTGGGVIDLGKLPREGNN